MLNTQSDTEIICSTLAHTELHLNGVLVDINMLQVKMNEYKLQADELRVEHIILQGQLTSRPHVPEDSNLIYKETSPCVIEF